MDSGFHMFIEGDDIWAYAEQSSNRAEYAQGPVQEGFEWSVNADRMDRYGWEDQGSIDVPAGSFDRCWRRVLIGATDNFIVLCRGVGLVVTQSVVQNYRLELLEKNF